MSITPRRLARPLVAAALGLALASTAAADTIVVQQSGFSFVPRDICVSLGDTVRWEWTGSGAHTVTEGTDGTTNGDEAFDAPLTSGSPTVQVDFDAALLASFPRPDNRYDYFCVPHFVFDMKGSVTVIGGPGEAYCACDTGNEPCNNGGACGEGCRNSTGEGGALRGDGSASVGADDLAFTALDLLPNQPALLFAGTNAVNGGNGVPFGDGLRCAGQNVVRLGVDTPDAAGTAQWGPGLGAAGGWSAGETRFFQGWYRDPQGSPCGNGFNLTNGYSVAFVP